MIIISNAQFNAIVEHAKTILPNEDCGLLGGTVEDNIKTVKKIYFLANIDNSPEHFSMDVNDQFTAVKDIRANGWKLLGNFHSHPETPARPSAEDKRLMFDKNLSYMILSLAETAPVLKSFTFDTDKNIIEERVDISD